MLDAYPVMADVETSSENYARRFSGPAGVWMLKVQERIVLEMLAARQRASILDVGGGHGQLAEPLCRRGHQVTVLGSSASCESRISHLTRSGLCAFQIGNLIDLPYPDNSFDVAISFRLMTHCSRWQALISELCRVACHAVIVDYPTSQGLNAMAPLLFSAKRALEGDTRTWKLFRHQQILETFESCGFRALERRAQFFLPMVLHRTLQSRTVSLSSEALFRAVGLTALWGSPVIVQMVQAEKLRD